MYGQLEILMNNKHNIVSFNKADLGSIKELLKSYHLPVEDIDTSEISFSLIKEGTEVLACAGVERFNEFGLLRSVAVKAELKGKGIGSELINAVLVQSKSQGIKTMYLLTETAESFFRKKGFTKKDRSEAPENIKQSIEFAELCPASAVLMKKIL